jgi:hypothetical protein
MSSRRNNNDDQDMPMARIPMEEDETLMSQGGGATPMAYSNRQSLINS